MKTSFTDLLIRDTGIKTPGSEDENVIGKNPADFIEEIIEDSNPENEDHENEDDLEEVEAEETDDDEEDGFDEDAARRDAQAWAQNLDLGIEILLKRSHRKQIFHPDEWSRAKALDLRIRRDMLDPDKLGASITEEEQKLYSKYLSFREFCAGLKTDPENLAMLSEPLGEIFVENQWDTGPWMHLFNGALFLYGPRVFELFD